MPTYRKRDYPVSDVRRFLEPGPIVLVTSAHEAERNVMTLGWHTLLEFTPSLVGCLISELNHSHGLIRRSRECVINVPEVALAETVVKVGNCSGRDVDKFALFGLRTSPARRVEAPLLRDCYANFECRLVDARLVRRYNFFIFEVVKAHVATSPRTPSTLHYRGDGEFMLSGKNTRRWRRLFRPEML